MLKLPPHTLRPGDRACVAVSGGADSVALLCLLHAANQLPREALGVGLSAVHINHSLRGEESDDDQAFVTTLCARLDVPLRVFRYDTAFHAAQTRQTIEEAARHLRHEAFAVLFTEGSATHVLTAHTLDDQAETVLMKLLRGAWLEGLSGIAAELQLGQGNILRPLLGTGRKDLRDFLREQGQTWREDSSNTDKRFTRNRMRHDILPLLRVENPSLDRTLANLAQLATEEEARWAVELKKLLPQLILPGKPVRGGGRANSTAPGEQALAIELDRLRHLDPAARRRVVRAAALQLGCRLSFDETARLLTLAGVAPGGTPDPTVPTKLGGRLQLSDGLLGERSARELRLSRTSLSKPKS